MEPTNGKKHPKRAGRLLVLAALLTTFSAPGCNRPQNSESEMTKSARQMAPAARQILTDSLHDRNPLLRANAIEVVADCCRLEWMPRVHQLLTDEVVAVRFAAALAVGDLRYRPAEETLQKMVRVSEQDTKIAVAYALYQLGHKDKFKIMLDGLRSNNQTVRANSAFVLGKTEDKQALPGLYWVMTDDNSSDKVSLQAAEAVARIKDEKIYPKLWAMLLSAYVEDRMLGVNAMRYLGTEKAKNALITMLDDDVVEVRVAAAEQLGRLGDTIGQEVIVDVFRKGLAQKRENQGQVRLYRLTALAIGEVGTMPAVKYLPGLLEHQSRLVQIAAAKAVLRLPVAD